MALPSLKVERLWRRLLSSPGETEKEKTRVTRERVLNARTRTNEKRLVMIRAAAAASAAAAMVS